MPRIPLTLRIGILLLALSIATPWPTAAAPRGRAERGRSAAVSPLHQLWSWLAHAWEKNGCMIDPHGGCLPVTGTAPVAPAQLENGCLIDPNGRCRPAGSAAADNGCGIDPGGRCGS